MTQEPVTFKPPAKQEPRKHTLSKKQVERLRKKNPGKEFPEFVEVFCLTDELWQIYGPPR